VEFGGIDVDKDESRFKRMSLWLKFLTAAGAIVAFLVSFAQWLDARRTALRQENQVFEEQQFQHKKDYQRAMFDRQTALYFEASDTAATIASTSDLIQRRKATDRFNALPFGGMVMVESPGVEQAMVKFHKCMEAQGKDCTLSKEALTIGCATRRSLRKTWDINFGKLETNDEYCNQLPE
jgi:hypothetical protein